MLKPKEWKRALKPSKLSMPDRIRGSEESLQDECGTRILCVLHGRDARATYSTFSNTTILPRKSKVIMKSLKKPFPMFT